MKLNKYYIAYFLFGIFLALIFQISGIIKLFETFISLIIYSIITFFLYFIWKKSRNKSYLGFNNYLQLFIYKVCIFIYIITITIGAIAYYNNEISPAKMPEYTISDGKKIVVFQAMSHIAKKDFYNQIKNNIKQFKTSSGVYFYEGVKAGSKESSEKFDKAIGINFSPELYKNMSKLYGVTFQDNNDFLGLVNNLDFNVDLNLDEIIKIYEEKNTINPNKKSESSEIINASEQIIEKLNLLNDKELKILVYINQAILNIVIKNNKFAEDLLKDIGNQNLFDVILEKRNENLANEIIKSNYSKIYITYGLLHFDGVMQLLRNNNPKWNIIKTNYLVPIK